MTMLFHDVSDGNAASLKNSGFETISERRRSIQICMFVM